MKIIGRISKGFISIVVWWYCLVVQPGGSSCASGVPSGAGSLDTGFFAAMGASPDWDGTPTVRRIVLQSDGKVLICGGFDQVQGFARRGLARLLATGSLDRGFVPAAVFVRDLALEPDGKIVVAANYTGLVRLNTDGTLDPTFEGTIDGGATAVVRLPGGELLAGLHLDNDTNSSTPGYSVALFDAQGHPSPRWSTQYRSLSPVSFILLAPGEQRIVVDGLVELALDASGNNFKYLTNALPSNSQALCGVFQPDGKLLLGFGASSAGVWNTHSTFPSALVRLNPGGSLDQSFATNFSVGVGGLEGGREQIKIEAVALQPDGKILIGGFFTRVSGEPRSLVARLLPDGGLDAEFVPDLEVNPGWDIDALQTVSAMALTPDGGLLIGGVLTRINGLACHTLARLYTASETSGGILQFAESAYYAWETNGTLAVEVVRFGPTHPTVSVIYEAPDLYDNLPVPGPQRGTLVFGPGETRKTITLPLQDNRLLDGNHSFRLVLSNPSGGAVLTGMPETKIVILDDEQVGRPGSVDLSYSPLNLEGVIYSVSLLAREPDDSALVSVQATTNYWSYQSLLLRLSPAGAIDPGFHPAIDQAVASAFPDPVSGKILITGGFSAVNGQARTNVARLNHDGTLDTAFEVISDNWISGAIVQPDGKIVIYGYFYVVNGVQRRQLARLLPDGSVDPEFDTSAMSWIGSINCIASQTDGKILIGGFFNQVYGVSRTNLARLNRDGSLDTSFVPMAFRGNPSIYTLLFQPDNKVLAGGSFGFPEGGSATVIRLLADGSRDTTFRDASPSYALGQPLLLQADGKIVVDGKWRLNPDGSRDYSFFTGDDNASVNTAALLSNGDLLVSGGFATFDQWPRPFLARLHGGTAPAYGFFEFAESIIYVNENAGSALVRVRRVGATNEMASVECATADAISKAGVDYTAVSGTLQFAPGEDEKTFSIPIIANDIYQGERFFNMVLRDTTPGVRAPSAWPANVIISDDDPGLTFSQTNYWVPGDAISTNGYAWQVNYMQRHGDLDNSLTVQCQLVAGTAVAGQDFIATNLTLQFPPYQYEVPVMVPLLRNDQAVADRTLFLVLNHPDPNVSLATDATAILTIMGKPRPPGFVLGSSVFDKTGRLRLQCDFPPGQYLQIQTSTNLVDWIYLGWVHRELNDGPFFFEDPDAWKYGQRFYRFPQYSGSGD